MSFFRSPPGRAGYFCFGKSSQNHRAGHDGLANVRLAPERSASSLPWVASRPAHPCACVRQRGRCHSRHRPSALPHPCASRRARAGANESSQATVHGLLSRPHVLVRALAGARQCRAKSRLALSRAPCCDARRHATALKLAQHGHPWPAFQMYRSNAMLLQHRCAGTTMSTWQLILLFGGLAFAIGQPIDLRKAVEKVQKQVEHLHNSVMDELEER